MRREPVSPFWNALVCPSCRTDLTLEDASRERYGVLSCAAGHAYPLVDGIPVMKSGRVDVLDHTSGRTEAVGPTVEELVATVRGTDPLAALVALLALPPRISPRLRRLPGSHRLLVRGPIGAWRARRHRADLRRRLERPVEDWSAQEWVSYFYVDSHGGDDDLHPYFLHRFAMPRHLATMALCEVLPGSGRILDLACGLGHVMHHWTKGGGSAVEPIGVDRNFFQLWVGQHWVAPRARFVCADAHQPLPFADDAFAAAMCSDAFHLLPDPGAVLDELLRCASAGPIVLDRVGNGLQEPHDMPDERTPQQYSELIGATPHRVVAESGLIGAYLAGRGLALADDHDLAALAAQKWLSLVISPDGAALVDHPPASTRLHASGPLSLNPIYARRESVDGSLLVFEFPSTWFAFENWQMLGYHAAGMHLSTAELEDLAAGRSLDRETELAARFVLLSLPERYVSAQA